MSGWIGAAEEQHGAARSVGGGAAAHDFFAFFAAVGSMRKAEAMSRAQAAVVAKERILGRL